MWRIALIAGCLVIVGCGVVHARGGSKPTFAANQRVAPGFAQQQLSAVALPPGTTGSATDPAVDDVLAGPQSRPGIGQLIDLHRFWRVPGTPAAMIDWLGRHPPRGTRLSSWGSRANRGVPYVWTRGYSYRALPSSIYEAELDFAIAAAKGGGTAVRVDSFAAGLVPRPPWERIPATASTVVITARRFDRRHSYSVARVTNRATVARLLSTFDGFHIVQPGTVFSCPLIMGASPQLRFQFMSATGTELAEAAESGCGGLSFAVGRRSGPALQPAVDLTQLLWLDHLLAVCSALSVEGRPVTRAPAPVEFSLPLTIRDTGAGACGLRGYPQVRLMSASGPLVPRVTRIPAGHKVSPPPALLDPTWPATTSISWPARPGCRAPSFKRVQLRLPGVTASFTVRLAEPISPCGRRIMLAPL